MAQVEPLPGSMLGGVGLGVGIAGTPLIPALPISVEPNGTPVRVAPPGEAVEGDEEYMALPPGVEVPTQGEAAFPDAAMPVVPPVPIVPPVAAVLPIAAMPPPSKVPVELDTPDIPEVELPAAEHGVVPPIVEPYDGAPYGIGLTPFVPSSVAPNGMPAGATDRLPVMPSGEVGSMPGDEVDGICAKAALPLRRAATVVAINMRLLVGFSRHGADRPDRRGSTETKHGCMVSPHSRPKDLAARRAGHRNFGRWQPGSIGDEALHSTLCSMPGTRFFRIAAISVALPNCAVGW